MVVVVAVIVANVTVVQALKIPIIKNNNKRRWLKSPSFLVLKIFYLSILNTFTAFLE